MQQKMASCIDEGPSIEPGDFVIDVSSVLLLETLCITSELNFLILNCIFFTGFSS